MVEASAGVPSKAHLHSSQRKTVPNERVFFTTLQITTHAPERVLVILPDTNKQRQATAGIAEDSILERRETSLYFYFVESGPCRKLPSSSCVSVIANSADVAVLMSGCRQTTTRWEPRSREPCGQRKRLSQTAFWREDGRKYFIDDSKPESMESRIHDSWNHNDCFSILLIVTPPPRVESAESEYSKPPWTANRDCRRTA